MDQNQPEQGSIFINGRAQVIEMLQFMSSEEKAKLIRNIRSRNPQLADELMESAVSFRDILKLDDDSVSLISQFVKAPIMGVALKALNPEEQRKILVLCERSYAEEAFKVMRTSLTNEVRDTKRACERVKSVIAALHKRKRLSFSV